MKSSIFFKKGFTHTLKSLVCGFTLIELVVVMAIATIMMTALIINQNTWNDQLAVNTQAYELVLMIRQAQIYSLGAREDTAGSGDKFNIGYGVHFDQSNLNRYVFFADRNGNKKWDSGEEIEIKTFNRGVTIEKFCGIRSGSETCSNPLDKMDISFFRPETRANLVFLNGGSNPAPGFTPPATVYIRSLNGNRHKITVETNGQVSITQI
jgi:prepilin-type N-terminal cleavage/methylation domain-containing protein